MHVGFSVQDITYLLRDYLPPLGCTGQCTCWYVHPRARGRDAVGRPIQESGVMPVFMSHVHNLCFDHLPSVYTGLLNLHTMLDTLLPNNPAAVQELLSDVAEGLVWQRVLAVPPTLVHPSVSAVKSAHALNSANHLLTDVCAQAQMLGRSGGI